MNLKNRRLINFLTFYYYHLLPSCLLNSRPLHHFLFKFLIGDWFDLDFSRKYAHYSSSDWVKLYDDLFLNRIRDEDLTKNQKRAVLKSILGQRLLEIGSGTGTLIEALPPLDQITGNDISHQAILFLKKKFRKNPRISFIEGDFLKIAPGKNFTTLVCLHVLEHVTDLPKVAAKMIKAAQRIIIIVPNEEKKPYMPNYHLHFFNSHHPITNYFPHRHNQLSLIDGDYFLVSDPQFHA